MRKEIDSPNLVSAIDRFPVRIFEFDRFKFGKQKYYQVKDEKAGGEMLCLDIACGAKPFPEANVLCDLNVEPVPDRSMKQLVTCGKPFVLCSCYALPFKNQVFDFVTSYYLIEHLDDPWTLVRELKRVSKHGYIQSPSWLNELLYGEKVHNWTVHKNRDHLYVKPIKTGLPPIRFGFIFHRLYRLQMWRILHAILDEKLHLFTVKYDF
ncbi:class I SAM-dependent methyltransferase [Candidatus Bathyarchaeota archaeon]|nr:class I SAM-dependent methyltransferase [Candidatus Bathyarchaeota archaeon]